MAIANGYIPNNAILLPHAVDLVFIIFLSSILLLFHCSKVSRKNKPSAQHSYVGFCGRYWEKHTYTRRKNYDKIKKVAYSLANNGIPVLIGPGWSNFS